MIVTVPFTIHRLQHIKPGERVRYYVGDWPSDLGEFDGAPVHNDLLRRVHGCAAELRKSGRVHLSEATARRTVTFVKQKMPYTVEVKVTEYWATGVAHAPFNGRNVL